MDDDRFILGEYGVIVKRNRDGGVVEAIDGAIYRIRLKKPGDTHNPTAFEGSVVELQGSQLTRAFDFECPGSGARRRFFGIPNCFYRGARYFLRK